MAPLSVYPACPGCTASKRQGQVWSLLGARLRDPGAWQVLWGVVSPTLAGGFPGRSWPSVPGHLEHLWLPQHHLAVTRGARTSRAQLGAGFQQAPAREASSLPLGACAELVPPPAV